MSLRLLKRIGSVAAILVCATSVASGQEPGKGKNLAGFSTQRPAVSERALPALQMTDDDGLLRPGPYLVSGFLRTLPAIPERLPRPQKGPEGIDAMFELSTIDAELEVIVGQSRFLRFKKEIARGPVQSVIAVGHPGIVEFDLLNTRMLRIVGRRVGTTDLSILTANNETYVIRVSVVYDLGAIRPRLEEFLPEDQLRLHQMRENVLLDGQTRDLIHMRQALKAVGDTINSESTAAAARISGSTSASPGSVKP